MARNTTSYPYNIDSETKKVIPQTKGVHQTSIYIATLFKDLRFNMKARKKKTLERITNTMEDLLNRIEFANKEPYFVDMTSENVVASRLLEAKIGCLKTDKNVYVYYFVKRYPGRTTVFVNSIDVLRRLVSVFKLLDMEVLGLHANMQQKQRLKSLERFKSNPKAVLVASDVAARGLDIPRVDHVIHYQLPLSGRTSRTKRDGVSSPEYLKILQK
jgi:ATP-dependent RNA helicase DDX24/MAK5